MKDKLNALAIEPLLSGSKTHVVNFVGNADLDPLAARAGDRWDRQGLGSAYRSYLRDVRAQLKNALIAGFSDAETWLRTE